jgi:AAA domain
MLAAPLFHTGRPMPDFFDIVSDGSPVFVTCLPNERGDPNIPIRWTRARSASELEQFIAKHDRPGAALYFAVAQLQDDAETRSTDTVKRTRFIWADIDFKDHPNTSPEEISQRLANTPSPPTWVCRSGHGLQLFWQLRDAEDLTTEDGRHRVVEALKLACGHVAGDPNVCEVARLMRLPGSHNSKHGDNIPVTIEAYTPERTYDLDALIDCWLEASPVLPEPAKHSKTNGHDRSAPDPFTRYASAFHAPHVDVEAALDAMHFGGRENGIHQTQLRVTASLTATGNPVEDTVERVLAATRKASVGDPAHERWEWDTERQDVARMCFDFINMKMRDEGKDLSHCLPDDLRDAWNEKIKEGKRPQIHGGHKRSVHIRGHEKEKVAETPSPDEAPPDKDGTRQNPTHNKPRDAPKKNQRSVYAKPFVAFDEAALPPREWLYAKHYQRGQVTATIGPGGAGKSSLDLVEGIAMATARNLLDEQPKERCRVWIHNGDDDNKEMNRRIAAVCRHYGIPLTELEGWLFATTKSDMTIVVAIGNGSLTVKQDTLNEIITTITENNIDVVILEPLVTLHQITENDNVRMNAVVHLFGDIADGCECAIDICHHTRKLMAGVEEHNSDDSRGASAIRDAFRGTRVINAISREEARKAGIGEQERAFYFRVDRGKANYLPPAAQATWRKFENVRLLNDDQVGVVTTWKIPEAPVALSDDDCAWIQGQVAKGTYRENKQRSPELWVGRLVATRLKLNPNEEGNDWAIRRGVRDLENREVIRYELQRRLGDARDVSYAIPGPWKKADAT